MAVTYVARSQPAAVGTTTTADTTPVPVTLPTGTAAGDRVFIIQAGNNTTGATPAGWAELAKDVQVGPTGTAPGAGVGRRYLSIYYRDYDGVWAMPSVTLTSRTQNTNVAGAITLRKDPAEGWDTPAVSTAGNTSGASTAYNVTTGALTTIAGAMLLTVSAFNDNVSSSAQTLAQSGAAFANVTERYDNGSTTGWDCRLTAGTADVTAGGTGGITRTATLSGSSEGGTLVVQQTVIDLSAFPAYVNKGANGGNAQAANLTLAYPASVAADNILIAHIYTETAGLSITPPSGWVEIGTEASSGGANTAVYRWYWKRAVGGETGSVTFTHPSEKP